LAEAVIASIDPWEAAARAAALMRAGTPVREAVVRSLGLVPQGQVGAVLELAGAYFDPSLPAPAILSELSGEAGAVGRGQGEVRGEEVDEEIAARIGVLVQACDATAALVEHRMRPQGRTTTRLALRDLDLAGTPIQAGTTVVLELGD